MDLKHLLWEEIPSKTYYLTVDDKNNYYSVPKITFCRDKNYRLLYNIEAEVVSERFLGDMSELKISPPFISSHEQQPFEIIVHVYGQVNANTTSDIHNEERIINKYRLSGEVKDLEVKVPCSTEAKYCKYWYANSDSNFYWNKTTDTKKNLRVKMHVEGFHREEINIKGNRTTSLNCCLLNINNKDFIFGKVEKVYAGEYEGSFIESANNTVLSESEAETASYLISFISGTTLIPLGKTTYGDNHRILNQRFYSSGRHDIGQLVENSKQRIIPASFTLMVADSSINWTYEINKLIDKYHSLKEVFPLNEVVENINTYRILPLRLKIQPLATAFDLLATAWFRSDFSKSQGKNLQDKTYNNIISKYISDIENDLSGVESTKPIINKIKYANNMSMNQRVSVFFEELGIKLSDKELEIIKTRNKIVHGIKGNIDYNDIYIKTHGYYSILGKVLLKILGYDQLYMDYSQVDDSGNPVIRHV